MVRSFSFSLVSRRPHKLPVPVVCHQYRMRRLSPLRPRQDSWTFHADKWPYLSLSISGSSFRNARARWLRQAFTAGASSPNVRWYSMISNSGS